MHDQLKPASPADAALTARLMADLDNDKFTVREQATQDLEKLGNAIEPALRKALAGQPSVEVRRRIERLLAKLDASTLTREQLRAVRAIEVMEHLGTPEARQLLQKLADGAPEARLTREAKAALERLKGNLGNSPKR